MLMMVNFGAWGILITVGLMLIMDFISAFIEVKETLRTTEIRQNNVLVSIEVVEHKGQNMFLVFESLNKKFILQGLSFDEIKDALKQKYEGKSIYVSNGPNSIEPIYIAPTSGLLPK